MVVLEGIVFFVMAAYVFFSIAPPIIMNIIWFKRMKQGKSKTFGPLGIMTCIVTLACLMSLPHLMTMIGQYFGWTE